MKREYISVSGKPIIYHYENIEMNHKPKCLKCGNKLNSIYHTKNNKPNRIGYFCKFCKIVFIYDKYINIIHIKRELHKDWKFLE